jgi:uncharacterized protein
MGSRVALRFSLDSSLGRLARYLRLLGHDAAWERGDSLERALSRARAEGRALITRSREMSKLDLAWPQAGGLVITSSDRIVQIAEIGKQWPVFSQAEPFSRCAECNEPLHPITLAEVRGRVPPYVASIQPAFRTCPLCTRIFWNGTHTERILEVFLQAAALCSQPLPPGAVEQSAGPEVSDPALPNG